MEFDLLELPPTEMDLSDLPPLIQSSTGIDLIQSSTGIDVSDWPPPLVQKDKIWLHKRTDHAIQPMQGLGLPAWEMDKAVSDAMEHVNHVKFTRVFTVAGSRIVIPRVSKRSSPSRLISSNPTLCKKAIASTFRIRMTYLHQDKQKKQFVGTAFRVAPTVSVTVGHCLQVPDLKLQEICGCSINPCLLEYFDKSSRMRFGISRLSGDISWGENVSVNGLFQTGSDVAFLRHEAHGGQGFLLPCSPRYPHAGSDIAVVSFSDAQSFLEVAKLQLLSKDNTPIRDIYKPAMAVAIAESIRRLAEKQGVFEDAILASKDLLSQAHMEVKQELLKQLIVTFGKFSSGMMLASIGTLIVEERNNSCLGTTVSLLAGSSGGAICCISLPGYFVGVHSGGSLGFDLNIATSTDCPEFCADYVEKVLPRIPLPDSEFWTDIDLDPFLHWIARRKCLISVDSPWLAASRAAGKVIKRKTTSRKKVRRG